MTLHNEAAEVMAAAGYENVRMDCDDAVQWELLWSDSWERVRRTGEAKLALTALLAFLTERGLRVVPVKATEGMQYAATKRKHGPDDDLYGTIYAAMIAAAADPFKEPTK